MENPLQLIETLLPFIITLVIIDAVLRLIALWKSARRNQLIWFICLGIINSLGILPAIYLILYRKKETETSRPVL